MKQYVYSFKQGNADGASSMSDLLGGKGANLAEMSNLNIPVPPGFTISTDVCRYFMKHQKYPSGLKKQVLGALQKLEDSMGQHFGSISNPLLVSIRSGAKISIQNGYYRPEIRDAEKSFLDCEDIRHPIVEKIHIETPYVTNNIHLGK